MWGQAGGEAGKNALRRKKSDAKNLTEGQDQPRDQGEECDRRVCWEMQSATGNSGKVLKECKWLLCWLWRMDLVETKGGEDLASESNLLFRQATFKVRAKFIYLFITNINICKEK